MKRNHRRYHRIIWALLPVAMAAAGVLAWAVVPTAPQNPAWPDALPGAKP
jgi:hypothetical protein